FADNHLTVAAYIREQRLQRLHQLLQTADRNIPLAILAERCGLWNVTNVSKAFRKRFGMSPSEARNGDPGETHSGSANGVPAESPRETHNETPMEHGSAAARQPADHPQGLHVSENRAKTVASR